MKRGRLKDEKNVLNACYFMTEPKKHGLCPITGEADH